MNRSEGITAIDGAMALIAILLVVQMWLLTATLEASIAGHDESILPAAIISGLVFAACAGLFIFIRHISIKSFAVIFYYNTEPVFISYQLYKNFRSRSMLHSIIQEFLNDAIYNYFDRLVDTGIHSYRLIFNNK